MACCFLTVFLAAVVAAATETPTDAAAAPQWEVEAFPTSLDSAHAIIVSVFCSLSLLGLVVTIYFLASGHTIRLSTVIFLIGGFIIGVTALFTWTLTYTPFRTTIHERTEQLLKTTSVVVDDVKSQLNFAIHTLDLMLELHYSGFANFTAPYPEGLIWHHIVGQALKIEAIPLVYLGMDNGIINGYNPWNGDLLLGAYRGQPYRHEGCGACGAYDTRNATFCAAYNTSENCARDRAAGVKDMCAKSCGFAPEAEFCVPAEGGAYTIVSSGGVTDDYKSFTCGVVVETAPYDILRRPWYTHAEGKRWSPPYVFIAPLGPGFTATASFKDLATGENVGIFAVDYGLHSLGRVLRTMPPTENSVLFLMDLDTHVLSTSWPIEQLAEDTRRTQRQIDNDLLRLDDPSIPSSSQLKRAARVLADRYGSLPRAMGGRAILQDGDMIMTKASLEITGGLSLLFIILVPYDDIMKDANTASVIALMLSMVCALALMFIFILVVTFVMRPLVRVANDTEHIAWMRLEDVQDFDEEHAIHEVQIMHRSFARMVANLHSFRDFLPASMFEYINNDNSVDSCSDFLPGGRGGPSQHAALVFTDIVRSTDTWEACPTGMRVALKVHNEVIRGLIGDHKGYEVKTVGDSFFVAFTGSDVSLRAILFAMQIQERLLEADWPEELLNLPQCKRTPCGAWGGLRVRIGISVGETDVEESELTGRLDFFGRSVNKAARMESVCIPGGVAISEEVLDDVQGSLDGLGYTLLDMGKIMLKGIGATGSWLLVSPALHPRMGFFEASLAETDRLADSTNLGPNRDDETMSSVNTASVMGKDLFSGRLSYTTIGVTGVVQICTGVRDAHDYYDVHTEVSHFLTRCVRIMATTGGTPGTMIGSSLSATWGVGGSINKNCSSDAMRFANALSKETRSDVYSCMGLCVGPLVHGNVGELQKFVTTIGPAVGVSWELSRAALQDMRCYCLVASLAPHRVQDKGVVRPVATWEFKPHWDAAACKQFTVWQLQTVKPLHKPISAAQRDASLGARGTLSGDTLPSLYLDDDDVEVVHAGVGDRVRSPTKSVTSVSSSNGAAPAVTPVVATTSPSNPLSMPQRRSAAFARCVTHPVTEWGWSEAYAAAFHSRDIDAIRANAGDDDVLNIVASHLAETSQRVFTYSGGTL